MAINFFNSIEHLEPRCKNCSAKIEYGVTTEWDDEAEAHVCIKCRSVVD